MPVQLLTMPADGLASLLLLLLGLHSGGSPGGPQRIRHPSAIEPMVLTAGSFSHKGMIPVRQTCDGHNLSPQLSWKGVPTPTKSLVLVVENPDAPNAKVPSVHWVLYNMPAQTKELAEGVSASELPTGTLVGMNDWRGPGYAGPCSSGERHRYTYRLFALDARLRDLQSPGKATLEKAMQGHILARAELIGTYQGRP